MPEVAGEGAILVHPEAYGSIAEAMQQLIDDDQLHARLSKLARANAGQYSWRNTASRTLALYQKML